MARSDKVPPPASSQLFPLRVVIACRDGIAASALQCFIDRIPGVVVVDRPTDLTGGLRPGSGVPAGARARDADPVILLSARELQIFEMLVTGPSNRQLARLLGITERTVKAHIGAIMTKLRLESRLQVGLAAVAYHVAQGREPTGQSAQSQPG